MKLELKLEMWRRPHFATHFRDNLSGPSQRNLFSYSIERAQYPRCCAGPSAVLAALVASGIACDTFEFVGFLHAKQGQRQKQLQQLAGSYLLL